MKKTILLTCSFLVIFALGCGLSSEAIAATKAAQTDEVAAQTQAAMPTDTRVPTDTPIPTDTPTPTKTTAPTNTPNIAATQKYDEFYSLLEQIKNDGHISTTDGNTVELEPFTAEMAQIGWLRYWPIESVDPINSDFVFRAKFNWSSAATNPESSGCGFVFGIQGNGDYYAVYLTNDNIAFFLKRGSKLYRVGKTSGSGVYDFDNPAEAEFAIAVHDQKAYVLVDGVPTLYTLSVDQTTNGYIGNSVLSGTNKDYGTRCETTDAILWTPE